MKTTPVTSNGVAHPDFANLPKGSLLRLYLPETWGNSFSLDGFPALTPGLPAGQAGTHWSNRLVEIIEQWGAMGMTTNQTLFRQLVEAGALDERLRALKSEGRPIQEIYRILYNEAATQAARAFEPIHAHWPWEGRVSQEASAFLTELDPLVHDVQRIALAMKGVGAFTKIPNLPIGPQAIRQAVAGEKGETPHLGTVLVVHPNVTLVFSDHHYVKTVEGYLLGLKDRVDHLREKNFSEERIREDLGKIASVNSLFVSRVDRVVDPMIEEAISGTSDEGRRKRFGLLKGKVAVAQAKKIYEIFQAIFLGLDFRDPENLYADSEARQMLQTIQRLKRLFEVLKAQGAHPQRLLIASSGVKTDQPYSPLLYVLGFLGPWTAHTLPEATLGTFSRFVAGLSDSQVTSLKSRNLMREPLPAIPTDVQPTSLWEEAILKPPGQRRSEGIGELTPDEILQQAQEFIFRSRGTSLKAICDTLRDKGAAAFTADEQATLQAIQSKLTAL